MPDGTVFGTVLWHRTYGSYGIRLTSLHARAFLKDLKAARLSVIIDIIHSGEAFEVKDEVRAMQKTQRMYLTDPSYCR